MLQLYRILLEVQQANTHGQPKKNALGIGRERSCLKMTGNIAAATWMIIKDDTP